jgi:hypothetical protein
VAQLESYWSDVLQSVEPREGFLYLCLRNLTRLHQFTELSEHDGFTRAARSQANFRILVKPQLDRQGGHGGVLAGLFDTNPIARGIIAGGVAAATGVPPALTAASALGAD